jgi:hypothetical protein
MRQAKGTGKLVDFDSAKVECQVCNEVWYPPIKPDGWFYQDAFQCPVGCTGTALTPNEPYQDTGGLDGSRTAALLSRLRPSSTVNQR